MRLPMASLEGGLRRDFVRRNKKAVCNTRLERSGGKGRDRTGDARIFSPSLYQLSYPATLGWNGEPGGNRTPNLLVRSQTLYPIELRVHFLLCRLR